MFIPGDWVRIFSFPPLWSEEAMGLPPPAGAALAMSPGWSSLPDPCFTQPCLPKNHCGSRGSLSTSVGGPGPPREQSPCYREHLSPSLSAPLFWIHFSTGHREVLLSLNEDGEVGHRRFRVLFSKDDPTRYLSVALDDFSLSQNESDRG